MTRHRVAGLVAITALLSLALAAPVAADTVEGPNGDRVIGGAGFEFVGADGRTYSAGADVIEDHLAGTVRISASFFNYTDTTCPGDDPVDPSDDYDASIELGFYADAPATTARFGSNLSSARATGRVSGDVTSWDPCTGESTIVGHKSFAVAIDLKATGKVVSDVNRDRGRDEDGNPYLFVFLTSERPAAGTVKFGGTSHAADGVILKQWWHTYVGGH